MLGYRGVLLLVCATTYAGAACGGESGHARGGHASSGRCPATHAQTEGPFYVPGAPERADLRQTDPTGTPLRVTGSVLRAGSCKAVAGATVDVWQADETGQYDERGFRLRGVQMTDADGRFEIDTVRPAPYTAGATKRTAHVHVKVRAKGYRELTTQLYFDGEPRNRTDSLFDPTLVMKIDQTPQGQRGQHDLVVEPG